MKHIISSLILLIAFMASCNEERNGVAPTGTLYLNVDRDVSMITKAEVVDEALKVHIINAQEDTVKTYNDYLAEVRNAKLVLPVGKYTISVVSNQTETAGWEKPFYSGLETVEVKSGEITNVKVVCKIANTKVSVGYSDGVKEKFINYETMISNSSGSLLFTRDEYRAGFFTPEKLTADLHLTNKDGRKFTLRRVFTDIRPRYYYTIMFKIDDKPESDEAGGNFELEIDPDSPDVINCIITITEDALEGKGVPEISLSEAFKENKALLKEGKEIPPLSLRILSQVGIKRLTVETESELFGDKGLTSFDLMNLKGNENALNALGFPLVTNGERNKITLDFEEFAKSLVAKAATDKKKSTYTFSVFALDDLHQETTVAFTFDVQPDMPVSTDRANAFSTFAFLYGESSSTSEQGFKYRLKGTEEYKEVGATAKPDGSFYTVITGLEPGKEYEYYAIVGTESVGTVEEFKTEGAIELPGGHFKAADWNGNDPVSFWSSGNNTFVNNLLSPTSDAINLNDPLNTTAAQLKSMKTVKFAAGNLFTGSFKMDILTQSGKITFDQLFASRPTKLVGWYKYTPQPITESGVITMPSGTKVNVNKSDSDTCSVYIALSKESYVLDTNNSSSLFDLNTADFKNRIIAYGELPSSKCLKTDGYQKFEIILKYLQPDYQGNIVIAIVCASSKYGDYFKGADGSVLLLDELELGYEYDESSFK